MRRFAHNPRERQYDHNPYKENPEVQRLQAEYLRAAGLPPAQPTPYVKVNENVAKTIAAAFEAMPNDPSHPLVREAYAALVAELMAQYEYVRGFVDLIPFGDNVVNPYADSPAMMDDIFNNHRLLVYDGGSDHAILSRRENWIFRGVHDFFGHAAHGFAFGPRGEENAWIEHSKMFTPLARWSLSTETRAQNSWVNQRNQDLPPNERPYAEQKANLLPVELCIRPEFEAAYREWPEFKTETLEAYEVREVASNPSDEFGEGWLIKGKKKIPVAATSNHTETITQVMGLPYPSIGHAIDDGWIRLRVHPGPVVAIQARSKNLAVTTLSDWVSENGVPQKVALEWPGKYIEEVGREEILDLFA